MRCLIVGGAGFIGLHLARRLIADGHHVTLADNFSRGVDDGDLRSVVDAGAVVQTVDVSIREEWESISPDWDVVYHLAAVVGVRNVERDPLRVIQVNTASVLHLVDWALPGTPVFFSSTSEVYAGGLGLGVVALPTAECVPVVIEDVGAPRFAYAISKLLGEAVIIHATRQGLVKGVVGRFHNVYGPRMGTDHVIPEMLLRAADQVDPFVVPGADQTRSFCYVDDAVDAVVRLMSTPTAVGRIVHIGDDTQETYIADLAPMVADVVGVDPAFQPAPGPAGSVARRRPDLQLLRTLTGYSPTVPLTEGLRRTWQWYRAAER